MPIGCRLLALIRRTDGESSVGRGAERQSLKQVREAAELLGRQLRGYPCQYCVAETGQHDRRTFSTSVMTHS